MTHSSEAGDAGAALITGATIVEARSESSRLDLDDVDERLAAAGIEPGAAQREAALVGDVYESFGVISRHAVVAAFLSGLELGARCARLAR